MSYYDYDDYDDSSYDSFFEPELEDYEDEPWIWPGYGGPIYTPKHQPYKRFISDLRLAMFLERFQGGTDADRYEIGVSFDRFDKELIDLFDAQTAVLCASRINQKDLQLVNTAIWKRLNIFRLERNAYKRMLLYGIDKDRAADEEDQPVYGGTITVLYTQLQEALLDGDRVCSVGLQTTIQSMDAAVESDEAGAVRSNFPVAAVRPKKFVPDPDAW